MKFAYIIMAHNNIEQLLILLKLLDDERNDIYLHIDKKSSIEESKCISAISKANIYVYKKYKIYWGDVSQTKCQFFLLKEAIKVYHDYYHLISGQDLPLMTNNDIQAFYMRNKGKQFIHIESDKPCEKVACSYYHLFDSLIKRTGYKPLVIIENMCLKIQKNLHIQRRLFCGANWFSITHLFAVDYCKNSNFLLKKVKWTVSSDEYVLQTFYFFFGEDKYELFCRAECPEDYRPLNRAIDWTRGNPYVWKMDDFEYLINSGFVYGRKFDINIDAEVIYRIRDRLMS